jgi:hypothetical protein
MIFQTTLLSLFSNNKDNASSVELSTINPASGSRVIMCVRCKSEEDTIRLAATAITNQQKYGLSPCSQPIRARGIISHQLVFHQELFRFCR